MSLIQCPDCKKKISDNAKNCPNCGYPLSREKVTELAEKQKKENLEGGIGIILIIIILIIFFKVCSDSQTSKDTTPLNVEKTNNEISTSEPIKVLVTEELNQQIKRELESFNKPFNNSKYDGTVEAIQIEIVLFQVWAKIINKGETSSLVDNVKLARILKTKVTNLQIKEFPILRKRYGKLVADKMWENDINVKTIGFNNTILDFTGAIFATNKNIKDFQESLSEVFTMFRFKEIRYRWYEGADKYTYYKLETPLDKVLITNNN